MTFIKKITVSGFRGILTPVELPFVHGGKPTSMALFGRNGYGKSSLTDAWEWLQTDKIERLGREGAGASTFPHRSAKNGESYIEVEFATLGSGKITFNQKKITIPTKDGAVDAFRQVAPYPCSLRYEDLTRFVFYTKAEQYDALAVLMGFTPQVEYQKMLRRVSRKLEEEATKRKAITDRENSKLAEMIGDAPDAATLLAFLQQQFVHAGDTAPATKEDAVKAVEGLKERIKNDPRAAALANHSALRKCVAELKTGATVEADLIAYATEMEEFKSAEGNAVDLILIGLYEKGKEVVDKRKLAEGDPCPLCGIPFEGSLADHIKAELEALQTLKATKDKVDAKRKQLITAITPFGKLAKALEAGTKGNAVATAELLKDLTDSCNALDAPFADLGPLLKVSPENIVDETPAGIRTAAAAIKNKAQLFDVAQKALLEKLDKEIESLKDDGARSRLVEAEGKIIGALKQWEEWDKAATEQIVVMKKGADFQAIADNYIKTSNADIESKFNSISAEVEKYFGILEEHTDGVGKPVLRLQTDQDRAVTLEIEFRGEAISPAYKYLSESQLNSFGLALFLATARRFNGNFRFLLLDDIVNSFDGYKRPQLIKLLKTEFDDFQFLVLTHDDIWCEQLFSSFPKWVRKRIFRYDVNTGPMLQDGCCELEKVEQDLDIDEPTRAGRSLGPILERDLQELCEAFEASVAYTRKNEHTLKPLLTRLIARVKDKLKPAHKLCKALEQLDANSSFRNFCSHWKNPSTPFTTPEISEVVKMWKDIIAMVKCGEDKCVGYVKYDKDVFVCSCKKLTLAKGDTA
ncbi:recombination protein F [Pirellula sp. SH-Sr6A]|uniref:AAA family ATPase n=1 Tax=Pirellula sp. SH-Sr6A TaxID=1632865 RepID=UPI00078C852B|nr:AAA family ATPase [Pirellula sp. SH-Sr6A]AMV34670.1 recombination protein F [Pirellula sp. SH-Sr6A]